MLKVLVFSTAFLDANYQATINKMLKLRILYILRMRRLASRNSIALIIQPLFWCRNEIRRHGFQSTIVLKLHVLRAPPWRIRCGYKVSIPHLHDSLAVACYRQIFCLLLIYFTIRLVPFYPGNLNKFP